MASVLATNGGLEVCLERLTAIQELSRGRPLLAVLLRLLGFAVKTSANRTRLTEPSMGAIAKMLNTLKMCLNSSDQDLLIRAPGQPTLVEELLEVRLGSRSQIVWNDGRLTQTLKFHLVGYEDDFGVNE
jgi:hypothetical protein